jgi:hypothetical protein
MLSLEMLDDGELKQTVPVSESKRRSHSSNPTKKRLFRKAGKQHRLRTTLQLKEHQYRNPDEAAATKRYNGNGRQQLSLVVQIIRDNCHQSRMVPVHYLAEPPERREYPWSPTNIGCQRLGQKRNTREKERFRNIRQTNRNV